MPPRKSKAKAAEDDTADQAPVRRSARTRRSVVQEEYDEIETEPPKKRARSARASASTAVNYEEENSNEPVKNEEVDHKDEELPKTPAKTGRGRGRKASEHKDTPHPKHVANDRVGARGRKRREANEPLDDTVEEAGEIESESRRAIKKSKVDSSHDSPAECTPEKVTAPDDNKGRTPSTPEDAKETAADPESVPISNSGPNNETEKVQTAVPADATDHERAIIEKEMRTKSPPTVDNDGSDQKPQSDSNVTNGDNSTVKIKPPSGTYEKNSKIGVGRKDLTVASVVYGAGTKQGAESTKASLEKLENPDVVATQKGTSATAKEAETLGFKVFGNGATRLLVRKSGSTPSTAHIEVKEPPETQSLIRLALKELNDVTSESNRKCVEDYLTTYCVPTDEFTEFTLSIGGKVVTLVNVQLESKNSAVTSLLIGCLMRKLDSRPHAFILTGYMPHVRPGNPAYELLREGYFGNHSIETLHRMRDIKLADEEERGKGLIDFVWKAYQHSRPWMRSVYETVLDGESVLSGTGQAVIWHSTRGVEAVRVFNHANIVKADLAIKSES